MTSEHKLTAYGSDHAHNVQLHRSVVGVLRYITITIIELTYSVNRVYQFMQAPLEAHW